MALADTIAPHLPFLRRYARALTGRQDSGDAYVAAVLKALIADPSIFPSTPIPRVGLYGIFSRIWSSVALNVESGAEAAHSERTIEALTPRSRQVFLLVSVEGFTSAEAARILGLSETEIADAIDEAGPRDRRAGRDRRADHRGRADHRDGPRQARRGPWPPRRGHGAHPHRSRGARHQDAPPASVLADIQLADGSSGLEAVQEMLPTLEVPVIFITAYPERLLSGERPEPVFLVTKPFQTSTVKAIVSQALFFGARAQEPRPRRSLISGQWPVRPHAYYYVAA